MPTYGGKDSKGKIIKVKPYESEGDDKLLWLTERQRGLLLAMTEYLDWQSRWETLPSPFDDSDYRDAYVSGLKNRLMIVVEFCEEVINCLDNDEDTQAAITRQIINNLNNNTTIQQIINDIIEQKLGEERRTSQNETNLNQSGLCDNGRRANAAIFLADWLHQNNQDFLEKVSSAATPFTRSKVLADNLPNFSTGTLGELISTVFTFFSAAYRTNYEAEITIPYMDKLAYDIYCASRTDCNLTIDDLYLMLSARVGFTTVDVNTFLIALQFAITGEWTGQSIADVMTFVQVGAFKFLGGFMSYKNVIPLSNALSEGMDGTDDIWETWVGLYGECAYIVLVPAAASVNQSVEEYGFDTEFNVTVGIDYEMIPTGVWNGGAGADVDARGVLATLNPTTIVPTSNLYRLVYRIGTEGIWYGTDDTFTFTASSSGRLYLALNDVAGSYTDNFKSIQVEIIEDP